MNSIRAATIAIAAALLMVGLLFVATSASAGTAAAWTSPLAPAATISNTITYQGRLLDNAGNPIDGTRVMTFSLYTQAVGGIALASQSTALTIDRGLFTAYLDVNPAVVNGQALWLGVQIQGGAEMSPRQPLLPAPYALSLRPGAVISTSFDRFANQGVLHVENTDASNDGGYGISVLNYSGNTWRPAIYGENRGASAGVYGRSDGWHGVVGWNAGDWAGVYGKNVGDGFGVRGESDFGYARLLHQHQPDRAFRRHRSTRRNRHRRSRHVWGARPKHRWFRSRWGKR